ncbi:hypothetical protein [Novosphingobium sp. 9]|uniref:hypothetical protein n=1 Tax=Novosphingobium sp. 9 TaxID=2025349 RepID=UPI0021B521FF|nr:hypothetical protein [Novosphingobium sp. 9]
MKIVHGIAIAAICFGAVPAEAADLILYPIQSGPETIRYRTGIPTLNIETATGSVTVTPLPLDHNHATFAVAVYNKGDDSVNVGIENVTASIGQNEIPVLSREELQKRAKSRAAWSMVGLALLSGVAAAAASTAHTTDHYYGNVRTPRGTYSWATSYRDNSLGVLAATGAVAAGTAGIVGIQNRLEYTLGTLATDILQTTTVDPDNSYGGVVVIEKPSGVRIPYDVTLTVHFNGADYPFTFRMTEQGKNKPPAFSQSALGNRHRAPADPSATGAPVSTASASSDSLPPPAASSS